MTDLPEPTIKLIPKKLHQFWQPLNLFTADQMREYRNQALEEAAKLIDSTDLSGLTHYEQPFFANMLNQYAAAIRALKEQK